MVDAEDAHWHVGLHSLGAISSFICLYIECMHCAVKESECNLLLA